MSKGYDPFSYGQVPIARSNQPGGSDTPEDVLFDSAAQAPFTPPTGTDQEWGMDPGPTFVPGAGSIEDIDLAQDILGASAQRVAKPADKRSSGVRAAPKPATAATPAVPAAAAAAAPGLAAPTAAPRPKAVPARTPAPLAPASPPTGQPAMAPAMASDGEPAAAPARLAPARKPAPIAPVAMPRRARRGLLGHAIPVLVLAGGAGASAYTWLALANPILGAIGIGCSLVGAAFAWFWSAR